MTGHAGDRIWADLLLSSYFILGLSLAAMFFLAVHHVAGATWERAIRRVPETMARLLPLGAVGVFIVLLAHPAFYRHSRPFFLARSAIYLVTWIGFAVRFGRFSRLSPTTELRLSTAFLVVLGGTLVPASFDWLMSLEPGWSSTIFAFYEFASLFLAGIAAIIVLAIGVWRFAPGAMDLAELHLHDLGKLLFAFSTFWAYLWFCQYMLIWYANIPAETSYFARRQSNGWLLLFVLNFALNWVVPFFVLISREAKMRIGSLLTAAVAVLIGRCLDLYLAVLPPIVGARPTPAILEIGVISAVVALFVAGFFSAFSPARLSSGAR